MIERVFSLEKYMDSSLLQNALQVGHVCPNEMILFLSSMLRIRVAEGCLAEGRRKGLIGGPVHLGVGQEAVAVAVSSALRSSDRVFGAHRSHSHLLALGGDLFGLFAEVLGREKGLSKGMGGSMHLWAQPIGFYGSVPIVAGTVPLAVGAGLAAKLQLTSDIAVAYLGDGAMEEGVVHESLNFARVQNVPVMFVVENNLFASHMHISERQPLSSTARFAYANDIEFAIVDGNDVTEVAEVAKRFVTSARNGGGPFFIEAITYRWHGHVDWRDDIDVGVNRSKEELNSWRKRDPIRRLMDGMINAGIWSIAEMELLRTQIEGEIDCAWQAALECPYASENTLLNHVYYQSASA